MVKKMMSLVTYAVACVKKHLEHQDKVSHVVTTVEDCEASFAYYANLPKENPYREHGKSEAEELLRAALRISKMYEDKAG